MKMLPTRADRQFRSCRSGSIQILIVFSTMAVLSIGALAINVAYIQLTMTEIRIAADSASKAALVELSRSQSITEARAAAVRVAQRHRIGGQSLRINAADIEFGQCERDGDRFLFKPLRSSADTINSARVNASLGSDGRPLLAFQRVLHRDLFQVGAQVAAARIDQDICLVLDRSGSMAWDLSSQPFSYPGENQVLPNIQNYVLEPHPTLSRWAALRGGVGVFLGVLESRSIRPQVAMITYASNYQFGTIKVEEKTLEWPLSSSYAGIRPALSTYSAKPLMGGTNIRAGLILAIESLTHKSTQQKVTTKKTIVLFSDGLYTDSIDPRTVIPQLTANKITLHSISLSKQADIKLMRELAEATGGLHVHAQSSLDLKQAFQKIADSIPIVLIQ